MTLQTSTLNTTKVKAPTPMIAQYLRVKEKHTDSLLLYRMGDFYEMFFEDARIGSETLGIALTKRGVKDGQDIPMCGVPVHSVEGYLSRLIKAGHKISICEQIEDPETQKKRGGKGPLRREVVRVLTAGTLVEDQLLQARRHNYLAALGRSESEIAISWADMSTGDFFVQETNSDQIETMLARIDPAELIYPEDFVLSEELKSYFGVSSFCLSKQLSSIFDVKLARNSLEMFYGLTSLDGLGQFSNSMLSAAGGLLTYLERTQVGNAPRLTTIKPVSESSFMEIDPATRRSLELRQSLSGEFHGSLVSALDFTQTAAGGRLLDERLAAPLIDISEINLRLDWVEWFLTEAACRNNVRGQLQVQPDIDRAFSRLSLGRGGPRDLASITNGILGAREIARTMDESIAEPCQKQLKVPSNLRLLMQTILAPGPLVEILEPALSDELPLLTRDGGFIRSGYNQELDALRSLRDKSRVLIVDLQKLYVEKTGISSLKIKHNNVLGFHVDVRSNHAEKLMNDDTFIHRQTTAQAVRFTTTELGELEHGIVSAADRILTMELKIFCDLLDRVKSFTDKLIAAAQALAKLTSQLRHPIS